MNEATVDSPPESDRNTATETATNEKPRHLLHVFPSFGIGGVPLRIATIINHFGKQYRHTIIALDGDEAAGGRLVPEVDVLLHRLVMPKDRPLRALAAYRRVLKASAPDLLLTYNWGAIEWGFVNMFLPVCPHIHFESGFGPEEADGQVWRRVLFRRLVLARADALVVPSRTLVDLATGFWRIPRDKVRYIPNGVDCARFGAPPDESAIAGFRRQPGERIVGTLAPLRPEKSIGRLIRAFAALPSNPPARLLIVGDGPERARLMALAEDLEIADRVVFAGNVAEPEKVIGLMDVFAISSDTEQMPNTLIQAMAAGRAVAAVAVGDIKSILAPENRPFVVPRADDDAFRDALARLLADAELRTLLGRCNKGHVRGHYDQGRMFQAYGEIFSGRHDGHPPSLPA